MNFNPFKEKCENLDSLFMDWEKMYPRPYDKCDADPYTRVRCILANGAEFEAVRFSHAFHRSCSDNDVRRFLAVTRRQEQQQQKRIACLKPLNETVLETTIGYEQLAVDLTAIFARRHQGYLKQAFDFALLEDFDHLYRYADLMELDTGAHAETLVGDYTEITPGRPTVSEHRYPADDVRRFCDNSVATPLDKLDAAIITAAEQQTMNYYMNQAQFYTNDLGRQLYSEIGMIEEQHVSHYGSLLDPRMTFAENLLMHEYTECYLYYSLYSDETDPHVKKIWEQHLVCEIAHLHKAAELFENIEKRDRSEVIKDGTFPEIIMFRSQKDYIRDVLNETVTLTPDREDYTEINSVPDDSDFFYYQKQVNNTIGDVASHKVIAAIQEKLGRDYRSEIAPNPVNVLCDRKKDNTTLGRVKERIYA